MPRGGSVRLTADAALILSGQPVRVYNMTIRSGNTASVVILRNGTTATDTAQVEEVGVALEGKPFDYGDGGAYFPAGCFVDVDANISYVTLQAELVR